MVLLLEASLSQIHIPRLVSLLSLLSYVWAFEVMSKKHEKSMLDWTVLHVGTVLVHTMSDIFFFFAEADIRPQFHTPAV